MVDRLGEGCGLPYASADDSTFTLRGQTVHRRMHADSYPPTPSPTHPNTQTHKHSQRYTQLRGGIYFVSRNKNTFTGTHSPCVQLPVIKSPNKQTQGLLNEVCTRLGRLGERCVRKRPPRRRPESYQDDTGPQGQEEAPRQKTSNSVPHL